MKKVNLYGMTTAEKLIALEEAYNELFESVTSVLPRSKNSVVEWTYSEELDIGSWQREKQFSFTNILNENKAINNLHVGDIIYFANNYRAFVYQVIKESTNAFTIMSPQFIGRGQQGEQGKQGEQGVAGISITDVEISPESSSDQGTTYKMEITLSNAQKVNAGDFFAYNGKIQSLYEHNIVIADESCALCLTMNMQTSEKMTNDTLLHIMPLNHTCTGYVKIGENIFPVFRIHNRLDGVDYINTVNNTIEFYSFNRDTVAFIDTIREI